VNYTTPAKLRIYGGFDYCDKQYLLAETKEIISFRWLQYNFKLEPIADYTHIIFEVFYKTPTLFPYNGNILLDNASPLRPMPCDEEEVVEEEEVIEEKTPETVAAEQIVPKTPDTPVPARVEIPEEKTVPTPPRVVEAQPAEEKPASIADLKREDLREGQTIRIDKLFFAMDKAIINDGSYEVLSDVYLFMSRNPDVLVEIGGHTNGLCSTNYCNQLSADRAEAVADYLMGRGISPQRLSHKGYGKTMPIATNSTIEGRKQNQRVEIKILGFSK
jgi:outer membrane protein OmpA-like peptidoglycan-associated protein